MTHEKEIRFAERNSLKKRFRINSKDRSTNKPAGIWVTSSSGPFFNNK